MKGRCGWRRPREADLVSLAPPSPWMHPKCGLNEKGHDRAGWTFFGATGPMYKVQNGAPLSQPQMGTTLLCPISARSARKEAAAQSEQCSGHRPGGEGPKTPWRAYACLLLARRRTAAALRKSNHLRGRFPLFLNPFKGVVSQPCSPGGRAVNSPVHRLGCERVASTSSRAAVSRLPQETSSILEKPGRRAKARHFVKLEGGRGRVRLPAAWRGRRGV